MALKFLSLNNIILSVLDGRLLLSKANSAGVIEGPTDEVNILWQLDDNELDELLLELDEDELDDEIHSGVQDSVIVIPYFTKSYTIARWLLIESFIPAIMLSLSVQSRFNPNPKSQQDSSILAAITCDPSTLGQPPNTNSVIDS